MWCKVNECCTSNTTGHSKQVSMTSFVPSIFRCNLTNWIFLIRRFTQYFIYELGNKIDGCNKCFSLNAV